MTDALLGMILLVLLFGVIPRDERLEITLRDVWLELCVWLALGAIVLGALVALDWCVRGPPF